VTLTVADGNVNCKSALWAAAALVAATLAGLVSVAPAGASISAQPAATALDASSPVNLCDAGNFLCMRDPSDGGTGTHIVTSALNGSNAEEWEIHEDTRCPFGLVSSNCPGGFISQTYGATMPLLVVISNYGAAGNSVSDCIKANQASSFKALIGSCDSSGTDEIASAFVELPFDGNFEFVSVSYGNDNSVIEYLTSYHNPDLDLHVGDDGLYSQWFIPSITSAGRPASG
jgi:hypothetical protein